MELKKRLQQDLKSAMLSGQREVAEVLRGLKSAILNEEIATRQRENGLNDEAIEKVIAREVKKRTEATELYERGGNQAAADKEMAEKHILSGYLPKQINDDDLESIVQTVVQSAGDDAHMGKIIGAVKEQVGNQANGARVAAAVRKAMQG